jgi:hypothetical protein
MLNIYLIIIFEMINYIMSKILVFKKEDMVDYAKAEDTGETGSGETPEKEAEEGAENA